MYRSALFFLRRVDPVLYALWAAVQTIASARLFYGYMLKQTGGEWSAPLDDVFIHFDYARATALGHPFEWTIGNGYSSGNTSLTYPFVLALGWLVGFTGRRLMIWAAVLAATSVFGVLLGTRRIVVEGPKDDWGRLSSYLLPPIFLGVGALDWSLWSGMEVAFFLATWTLAFVLWWRLEHDPRHVARNGWFLGLAGLLLVTTRPEAAFTIGVFGIAAALVHRRHRIGTLIRVGLLPLVALVLQAVVNKELTGESSANGAIVKLALNNPYMTRGEVFDDWWGNAQYASLRNLDYHFASIDSEWFADAKENIDWTKGIFWAGVVPLLFAFLPLVFPRTRRIAILLWLQILGWIAIVALNGQVRWQNERYVMPAVAWMLILAALGISVSFRAVARARSRYPLSPNIVITVLLGALCWQIYGVLTRPPGPPDFRLPWMLAIEVGLFGWVVLRVRLARMAVIAVALLFAYDHQIPKMRDQKFFFGRAARNIRDQHLAIGKYLAEIKPKRVLVGDAGAILYESDRPGLDIIGLGGYHGLPFARAGVQGLPATLELIERMPEAERPDVLAIFPTWWGVLPMWFTSETLRRFPVEGNVICGGYEQNVYRADWRLLGTGDRIRTIPVGDTVVRAEVDVADLVSEKASHYRFDQPQNGFTEMRVLPDPNDAKGDLFDAGRRIGYHRAEHFRVQGIVSGQKAHIVVRTAPEKRAYVSVQVDGALLGSIRIAPDDGWKELSYEIPAARVREAMEIDLQNDGPGDFLDYHVWITQ